MCFDIRLWQRDMTTFSPISRSNNVFGSFLIFEGLFEGIVNTYGAIIKKIDRYKTNLLIKPQSPLVQTVMMCPEAFFEADFTLRDDHGQTLVEVFVVCVESGKGK